MLFSSNVIKESGIQFGTSGARGLVTQFTSNVCAAFTHAFISCVKDKFVFKEIAIAIDNRPSSFSMAQACAKAVEQAGFSVVYYGVAPTPALAYVSMQDNIPSIMVTGSHIPFDRNGLKFYRPDSEISKDDELAILNAKIEFENISNLPNLRVSDKAAVKYMERYTSLFNGDLLSGKRIGIYEHSSAGRDLYRPLFEALGADIITLERSDEFVPIDTEAVSESDKVKAKQWSKKYDLDFIFSTDGDGDRPLVADENGDWLRGDILGLLCADAMSIEALAVPVSCNTAIESCKRFKSVTRTKIGSPYVIAEFDELSQKYSSISGFEANGGFILGSDVEFNNKCIKSLPTRDAVLPALMLLSLALEKKLTIYDLIDQLPKRFTYSDRIQNFKQGKSHSLLEQVKTSPQDFLNAIGLNNVNINSIDITDGLRITMSDLNVIHFRPSGNAPELRCYAESDKSFLAKLLVDNALNKISEM